MNRVAWANLVARAFQRTSSLYEAFEPSEARRLIEKIEPVHAPKHGSWRNMAECELSVLEKQALEDRVADDVE